MICPHTLDTDVYTLIKLGPTYGLTHQELFDQLSGKHDLTRYRSNDCGAYLRRSLERLQLSGKIAPRKNPHLRRSGKLRWVVPENVKLRSIHNLTMLKTHPSSP